MSAAPSAVPSSFLRDRQVLTRFSPSAPLHSRVSSSPVLSLRSVFTVCSRSVSLISTGSRRSSGLFSSTVSFTRDHQEVRQVWPAASVISSSLVFSRTHSLVSLCASRLCLRSTLLVFLLCPLALPALLRLPHVLPQVLPSHPRALLVVHEEEREVQPQAGCPQSSSSASVVFRQLLGGFL